MKELLFTAVILFTSFAAQAQDVEKQPQEVVEATPIESFSGKSEGWPKDNISQDVLDVQGSSLYDALNKYPGIQTQGEASSGSPSIRIRGSGGATRTLLLFNGTPINAQDGLGANPLLLPTEIVDSVDILKGPSSLFYGSDAVGGAINLKPRKFTSPTVRLGYESTYKPSVFLGSPLFQSEKHSLQGSVYLDESKGNYKYDDPTLGETKRIDNERGKQRYSLIGENKFSKTTFSHHFVYAREKGKSPGPVPYDASQVVDFDRNAFLGAVHVNQKINSLWNANYKLSHSRTDNDNTQNAVKTNYFASKSTHSLSTDYQVSNYANLELFTDFSRDDFESLYVNASKLHDEHFEHGLILKAQISESEYLLAGLRFFPDQNESVKNILLKQDKKDYVIWASYSEGLRIPDFTQRLSNAPFMIGNPNLDVEKSNQIEIGAETLIKKTKLKISGYQIDYKEFIQYSATPSPYSFENVQDVTTKGIELQASTDYKIYHGLISYSIMESKNGLNDENMPLIPKNQVYVLVGAQLAAFIFELHNTFWSGYKLNSTNETGSWSTTDLTVRTSGFNDWKFKAGVLNLFGKERVFTYGYPEPKTQYFVFAEQSF
ncbi:MAG: TonB-dependent receptor [Bdellovibrionota bacterium]